MIQHNRAAQVTAVALLSIFWAVNWPIMKIGLTTIEPWAFRSGTALGGGVGSLLVAYLLGHRIRVPRGEWIPLLWLGLFQGYLWNACSILGLSEIEAGRATVLAFSMPVWATLGSVIFLGERVTPRRILGLVLGMLAMALLVLPSIDAVATQSFGAFLMICAAMSWATATIVAKGSSWSVTPLVINGWLLCIGAPGIILTATLAGRPETLLSASAVSLLCLAFAALIPMIFCQAVYFAMVRLLPPSIASMGTLMVPPLGVFFSALMLGEPVGLTEVTALVLVALAMLMILPGFDLVGRISRLARGR
ncbi:DMT family transporter [Acuticoccus mangrovi]|uniref:DMT family transporter n=1 Tax=Acuticoccus mangrovi TaxID=2796142 RepID=A0A934IHR6_9HYPH|nr:DMT family transporter [Acuticoccus mangrovi]MBJ3776944.1 DMT family transporter [Acuticoccus mangrovi]